LREESLLVFCFQSGGILRFAQHDKRSTISATCLAAVSSTDEFSHRLESSTLSGRTVRFRKPRHRPWLESGGAFNAEIKVGQIRIHDSCWSAIYTSGLQVGQLGPRIVRRQPPQSRPEFWNSISVCATLRELPRGINMANAVTSITSRYINCRVSAAFHVL